MEYDAFWHYCIFFGSLLQYTCIIRVFYLCVFSQISWSAYNWGTASAARQRTTQFNWWWTAYHSSLVIMHFAIFTGMYRKMFFISVGMSSLGGNCIEMSLRWHFMLQRTSIMSSWDGAKLSSVKINCFRYLFPTQ